MKPSDDLFMLIQSLTASEKGYFRKQAAGESKKENNYLRLFDAMAKQTEYNEAAIKKQFNKETFAKQLNNTKLYLYQLILKHLREYHRQGSIKIQMRNLLDETAILLTKGLYKQADKKIQAHRKLALRYENLTTLLDANDYAESILIRTSTGKDAAAGWNNIHTEREMRMQMLSDNYQIRRLERELLLLNAKLGPTRNPKVLKEIEKFSTHPALKPQKTSPTFDTQFRFNQIHAMLALHRSDYKREAEYFGKNVELLESNPLMKEAYYKEYYPVSLHNYINASIIADAYAPAYEAIEKLKKERGDGMAQQARLFYFLIRDQTYFCIRTGDIQKGLALKKDFEEGSKRLGNAINSDQITAIHFNFAVLHLEAKEFTQSIPYLENALDLRHQPLLENIQAFARILLIINHYELGNVQLLPHLLSTTEFFLKKKQAFYEYEKVILQFFKKLAAGPPVNKVKTEATALKQKLKALYENPFEKNAALVFDFAGWLEKFILRLKS